MGIDQTYLIHHGIKGQQWGRRRYQNEDGTLTLEGKMRYADAKEVYSGHVGADGNLNKAGMHHIKLMEDMKKDAGTRKSRYGMQALVANGGVAVSALTASGGLALAAAPYLAKVSPRVRQLVHDLGIATTGEEGKKNQKIGLGMVLAGGAGLAGSIPAAHDINTTYGRAKNEYKKSSKSLKAYNDVLKGYEQEKKNIAK